MLLYRTGRVSHLANKSILTTRHTHDATTKTLKKHADTPSTLPHRRRRRHWRIQPSIHLGLISYYDRHHKSMQGEVYLRFPLASPDQTKDVYIFLNQQVELKIPHLRPAHRRLCGDSRHAEKRSTGSLPRREPSGEASSAAFRGNGRSII